MKLEYDHNQCFWHTVPARTTSSRGVAWTTPSATPTAVTTPLGSSKHEQSSPSTSLSRATAPYSLGYPGTPIIKIYFRSTKPTCQSLTPFVQSANHSQSLPSSLATTSFVQSYNLSHASTKSLTKLLRRSILVKQQLLPQPHLNGIPLVEGNNKAKISRFGQKCSLRLDRVQLPSQTEAEENIYSLVTFPSPQFACLPLCFSLLSVHKLYPFITRLRFWHDYFFKCGPRFNSPKQSARSSSC